jgi:hypothetical protein
MFIRCTLRLQTLLLVCATVGCGGAGAAVRSAPAHQAITPRPVAPLAAAPSAPEVQPWQVEENPSARYIATLGEPTAQHEAVREDHLRHARLVAAQTLQSYADIELAPANFDRQKLLAESARRKLLGVSFECGVVHHAVDERGTHFSVNVAVVDLRTEDIVATMVGSATAPGPTSSEAEQLALSGALEGAMRGVPKLLESLHTTLVAAR